MPAHETQRDEVPRPIGHGPDTAVLRYVANREAVLGRRHLVANREAVLGRRHLVALAADPTIEAQRLAASAGDEEWVRRLASALLDDLEDGPADPEGNRLVWPAGVAS